MDAPSPPTFAPAAVPELGAVAGRRRGVVPNDWQRQLAAHGDMSARAAARQLHEHLQGLAPSALTPEELEDLAQVFAGGEPVDDFYRAFVAAGAALLEQIGYGRVADRRARSERRHGMRRAEELGPVVGRLPRALALVAPTSADTHRRGPNHVDGVYGPVCCSLTLRAMHLGIVAAGLGLWMSRNPDGHPYTATTGGALAHMIYGYPSLRLGGADLDRVHELLADWEAIELSAAAPEKMLDGSNPRDYAIPCSPVKRVERLLAGRWVSSAEYGKLVDLSGEAIASALDADADQDAGQGAQLRIWWADWVLEAIREDHSVLINFATWTQLRPTAQTIYAYMQAKTVDEYDETVQFYLAAPMAARFGLRGRLHRSARVVREALAAIRQVDARYGVRKFSVKGTWQNTKYPMFRISRDGKPSSPAARTGPKTPAFRPSANRNLTAAQRAERRVAAAQRRRDGAPVVEKGLRYVKDQAARLRNANGRAGP